MTAHVLRRCESTPVISLWLTDDDVDLREKQQDDGDGSTKRDGKAHGDHLAVTAEIDRHERQPDDAGRVHGETDKLSLVEVLR